MKKAKLTLSLIMVVALLAVPISVSAEDEAFKDIDSTQWYYNAVVYVQEAGLFNGTGDNIFSPESSMTRAMFVQVLANKTANYNEAVYTSTSFSDVKMGSWYASAVEWASTVGLVSGTGNGYFSPEKEITREEMSKILYKYASLTDNTCSFTPSTLKSYNDGVAVSDWAKDSVAWALTNQILKGDDNGSINPKSNARRCEVAQVFHNASTKLVNNVVDEATGAQDTSGYITAEQAKEIALNHAGYIEDEVGFAKVKLDFENGRVIYEVEFYVGQNEYDYEIDATTGNILSYDYDIEDFTVPSDSNITITLDTAKEIALNHAGLTADQVTFTTAKLDYDDGVQVYEIEFYYAYHEYEYEINANTGNIISYEYD